MTDPRQDEFYVGYLPRAPRGIASFVRLGVVLILFVASTLAVLLVRSQSPPGHGVFEFGVRRELEGVIRERPYPTLLVPRPARTGGAEEFSSYYLSTRGKFGAGRLVAGLDGRAVHLSGSLVYRDDRTMLEVAAGTIEPLGGARGTALERSARPRDEDLGRRTLVGEIVDSKCFLGVMKPGNTKPHRSCAARCISGGVPPVLLVRDPQGVATYFLLVTEAGDAVNRAVLGLVAEPVEITGRVVRRGDLLYLEADPRGYRRLTN